MIYNLYKWSVVPLCNQPCLPPEANPICLSGYRNDETFPVKTTPVKKVNGREITTLSGSVYILEDIDIEYLSWCNNNNINYDYDNPIKIINHKK